MDQGYGGRALTAGGYASPAEVYIPANNALAITDYAEFRRKGEEIYQKAEEFKCVIDKIEANNNELNNSFIGADAKSYMAKVSEHLVAMRQLYNTIIGTSEQIKTICNIYEQTQQENIAR